MIESIQERVNKDMSFVTDRAPFSYIVPKTKLITSGNVDTLITRAPWPNGANRYYVLRKATAVNSTLSGGGAIVLWDQDLSSTTPAGRGSGASPLYSIPVTGAIISGIGSNAASTATRVGLETAPRIAFYAGITAQGPINSQIALELEVR